MPLLAPDRTLKFITLLPGDDPDTLINKLGKGTVEFQRLIESAYPVEEAVFNLAQSRFALTTPLAKASFETELQRLSNLILNKPYQKQIRNEFYVLFRKATVIPWQSGRSRIAKSGQSNEKINNAIRSLRAKNLPSDQDIIKPGDDLDRIKRRRARILLAICIHHPELLRDVEEPLALLDLPIGPPRQVRDALLQWIQAGPRLDSGELIAHLAGCGDASAAQWVLRPSGLPMEAGLEAQPKEAVDAFWQFFGFLRGEAELVEDARAAQLAFAATNDMAAQTRLIRFTAALDALRRGEVEEEDEV